MKWKNKLKKGEFFNYKSHDFMLWSKFSNNLMQEKKNKGYMKLFTLLRDKQLETIFQQIYKIEI